MHYDTMSPIWAQVAAQLRTDMATGRLKAGEKLPSGRELAIRCAINPNTAARVYQELEAEGLCETRRGLGTFVTGDAARLDSLRHHMARDAAAEFLRRLEQLGVTPGEALALAQEAPGDGQA
jgi:GntR family transcriptional regulator